MDIKSCLLVCLCVNVVTMAELDEHMRSVLLKLLSKAEHKTSSVSDTVYKENAGKDIKTHLNDLLDKMDGEISQLELIQTEQDNGNDGKIEDPQDMDKPPAYLLMLEKLRNSADKISKLQGNLGGNFNVKSEFANEFIDELRLLAMEIEDDNGDNSTMETRHMHDKYCAKFLKPCGGINPLCCEHGSFPGSKPFKQCCSWIHLPTSTLSKSSYRKQPTTGMCLPNPYGEEIPCKE